MMPRAFGIVTGLFSERETTMELGNLIVSCDIDIFRGRENEWE